MTAATIRFCTNCKKEIIIQSEEDFNFMAAQFCNKTCIEESRETMLSDIFKIVHRKERIN